jgi:PAS domain S-box-containing protein
MQNRLITGFQKKVERNFVKEININLKKEIHVDITTNFRCKINIDETFDYVNQQLSSLTGYEVFELVNEAFIDIKHPDMPAILYTVLKERFRKGLPMLIIEKHLAKNGAYFWLLSKYEPKLDAKGSIVFYEVHSIKAPNHAIERIKTLYLSLNKIESKTEDVNMSRRYLIGFLEDLGHTYNSFINEVIFLNTIDQKERIKEEIAKSTKKTFSKKTRSKVSKEDLVNSIQKAVKRGA